MKLVSSIYLFDKNGFKRDEHEESEERVVPVVIEAPQTNTEHLKYKKWSSSSLTE